MKQELQKAMLIWMFLSKYDKDALNILGFETFSEAFNVIGLSIWVKPLSIRNYRDEFDPVFDNKRKGWHKRTMYQSRKDLLEKYNNYSLDEFTTLVKTIIYKNPDIELLDEKIDFIENSQNTFAKRLITGQAAEQYFRENYSKITIFNWALLEDTTKLGCGFDFKLNFDNKFYAIEVKGLNKNTGSIWITEKEYKIANSLKENYFIFLVKNFIDEPEHNIFNNPISHPDLNFIKQEKTIIQLNWTARI